MKKKLITLLLATAVAVTSLVGCGQQVDKSSESTAKESSASVETSQTTEVAEENSNFNEEGLPIVNEEITLKIMLAISDSFEMIDPKDMPAIKRLEESTGIKTEWEVVKAADWDTKLNLMFASGEYPDLIVSNFSTVDYEEYGVDQEILIPLDDLIDKYMPNYTDRIAMENYDPTLNLVASDGQTYAVGYINNSEYMLSKYYINQEWLDALNLEMPKDIEGLTETLRAFKEGDPNGNEKADEIPLMANMDSRTSGVAAFLPLFGVPYNLDNYLTINDDKKVEFIPYMDGFRECFEWLHMCYDEGLLDLEVLSQDETTIFQKHGSKITGFGAFYLPNSQIPWGEDGSAAKAFALYTPDDTAKLTWLSTYAKPSAFITIANENPEATARFMNEWLEKEMMYSLYIGDKDDTATNNCGWDYDENGIIKRFWTSKDPVSGPRNYMNVATMFFAPGEFYKTSFEMSANKLKIVEADDVYRKTGLANKYSHSLFGLAVMDSATTEKKALIETEIKTAMMEHMAIFIKNGVTDDNWKAFTDVMDNLKVDEYVAMYQAGIDAIPNLD